MHKLFLLFCILFILFFSSAQSQNPVFRVEGIVHGIEQGPSQGLFRKRQATILQGTLDQVQVSVLLNEKLVKQVASDGNGVFQIELQFDQLYQLELTKSGYNKNQIIIDTRAFPEKIKKGGFLFSGAEFVLNSYEKGRDPELNRRIGRLFFSPSKERLLLEPIRENEPKGLFNSSGKPNASTDLIQRALVKNNENLKPYIPLAKPKQHIPTANKAEAAEIHKSNSLTAKKEDKKREESSKKLNIPDKFRLSPRLENPDEELIKIQEEAISREKEQLTIYKLLSKTQEDSLEIIRREEQIALAEKNIADARLLISYQNEKITSQQEKLFLLISLLVLLSGSSFLAFTYFRQRQKVSQLIESKNRQITDSINYAKRIQQSILISEDTLQQYFPESFVFLEPKAIVSGDFYFIAPVGKKVLVAVADCTGHGVPGAFMSLIGYRLLREIVVEKGIHDPALVLENLHTGINESLNQKEDKENSQDGMDVAICLIDPEARTLVFAGAMNPAYLVFNQELQVLQADVSSVGGKTLRPRNGSEVKKFSNKASHYNPACMLYLFTDGYMDQFGGNQDQKFNTRRFKQMLMDIQPLSATQQKEIISGTLKEWKRDASQTDDILMLGIRLF